VVGGGVGWSYGRRRRRAAHFSSAAVAWLYGRRRQTGRKSSETAIICYVDDNIRKLLNIILCTADGVSAEFQSCLM